MALGIFICRPPRSFGKVKSAEARRGARVHSINLKLFSIERSLFLRRKHANSVILSIT